MSLTAQFGRTRTEQGHCETHGEFEARFFSLNDRWVGGKCPTCSEIESKQKEQQEHEEREAERKRRLFQSAGIPPRFVDATLANYKPTTDKAQTALGHCQRYVETWAERREKGSSLILCGSVGTGKTHLACGITQELIRRYSCRVIYTTVAQAVRRVRSTYSRNAQETEEMVLDEMIRVPLLILDEVGIQSGTEHEHGVLFEIINGRYASVRPTIVISNLGIKDLSGAIGERLVDRLRENGGAINFTWQSYRGAA